MPLGRIWDRRRPDPAGLVLGTVFFILALTPSLLPRDVLSQGAPCGLCAGTGYPLGVRLSWNWRTWIRAAAGILWESSGRSLPGWWPQWKRRAEIALSTVVVLALNGILLRAVHWQQQVAALVVEELKRTGGGLPLGNHDRSDNGDRLGGPGGRPVPGGPLRRRYGNRRRPVLLSALGRAVHRRHDRARASGRALVTAVVAWWKTLPEEERPRLLLYGESLGVVASEVAFSDLSDVLGSIDGVLWVGPPNSSRLWRDLVTRRDPGTREADPVYSAGLTVRFAQDRGEMESFIGDGAWGDHRILYVLYVQHSSDPVVWWSPRLVRDQPDWLRERAGADRSSAMHWMPCIIFFQVSADLPRAVNVPHGHGHHYGTEILDGLALVSHDDSFTAERMVQARHELDLALTDQPADD